MSTGQLTAEALRRCRLRPRPAQAPRAPAARGDLPCPGRRKGQWPPRKLAPEAAARVITLRRNGDHAPIAAERGPARPGARSCRRSPNSAPRRLAGHLRRRRDLALSHGHRTGLSRCVLHSSPTCVGARRGRDPPRPHPCPATPAEPQVDTRPDGADRDPGVPRPRPRRPFRGNRSCCRTRNGPPGIAC